MFVDDHIGPYSLLPQMTQIGLNQSPVAMLGPRVVNAPCEVAGRLTGPSGLMAHFREVPRRLLAPDVRSCCN